MIIDFNGQISNAQIFDTALPATGTDSIETLYNNGVPLTTAIASDNLKAWYKLNNNDRFQINLKRNSVEDAGIGKAIYISGTGRYLNFINKECTYAVNYLNPKVGFYKQICKD